MAECGRGDKHLVLVLACRQAAPALQPCVSVCVVRVFGCARDCHYRYYYCYKIFTYYMYISL